MTFETNLKKGLIEIAKHKPHRIKTNLKKGDLIRKSRLYYEIDDLEIYKTLLDPENEKGTVPLAAIYKILKSDDDEIEKLKEKGFKKNIYEIIVPFSKAFNAGLGSCLEKAILVQLSAQAGRDSFLISGYRDSENNPESRHAFNVVFKENKPYLIDAENPLWVDKNTGEIKFYIAPITGIKGKNWQFIFSKDWEQNKTYSIE